MRDIEALYSGSVTWLDDIIGYLLESMEEGGILDDTVVILTADHGDMLGSHHKWNKSSLHSESTDIPMIVRWPKGATKGLRNTDSVVSIVDIMPTILDFAGLQHPNTYRGRDVEPMRGHSLTSVTSGASKDAYAEGALTGGEMINGKWMRKGKYKTVQVAKPFGSASWQLYNTASDPGENTDLSTRQPDILNELKAAWEQYAKDVGVVLSH